VLITLDFNIDATKEDILTFINAALVKDGYNKGGVGWEKDFKNCSDINSALNAAKDSLSDVVRRVATQCNQSICIEHMYTGAGIAAKRASSKEPIRPGVGRHFYDIQVNPEIL